MGPVVPTEDSGFSGLVGKTVKPDGGEAVYAGLGARVLRTRPMPEAGVGVPGEGLGPGSCFCHLSHGVTGTAPIS